MKGPGSAEDDKRKRFHAHEAAVDLGIESINGELFI
jgi:hypothetical protein